VTDKQTDRHTAPNISRNAITVGDEGADSRGSKEQDRKNPFAASRDDQTAMRPIAKLL